jgi:hypothetical protein
LVDQLESETREKSKYQSECSKLNKIIRNLQLSTVQPMQQPMQAIQHNAEEQRLKARLTEAQLCCREIEIEKQKLEVEKAKLQKDLEWTDKVDRNQAGVSLGRFGLMQSLIRWGCTAATATILLRYLL